MAAIRRGNTSGQNNYVLIVLDSCRFDSFVAARPRVMRKLGRVERRWSYASWTAPSHFNLLMGLLPHTNPKHVYASEYYKKDFLCFNDRLGCSGVDFRSLVPQLYLPPFLRDTLGYSTNAMVSLPVLNPKTPINCGFDSFRLMERHNDMRAMVREIHFSPDHPSFWLINVGETHYPYALPDEPEDEWPRLHGVHGVFKHLGEKGASARKEPLFNKTKLQELRARQVRAVKYIDTVIEELFDLVPKNTFITITADHGELFGEGGYFGHGPICHEKVFEVPFVEGKLR
jgi:hypothetical protein